jgi:hypothetical protein
MQRLSISIDVHYLLSHKKVKTQHKTEIKSFSYYYNHPPPPIGIGGANNGWKSAGGGGAIGVSTFSNTNLISPPPPPPPPPPPQMELWGGLREKNAAEVFAYCMKLKIIIEGHSSLFSVPQAFSVLSLHHQLHHHHHHLFVDR